MFEPPVFAFKIRNQRIEPRRTGHSKSYSDFIACTLLPKYVEICFVDDRKYEKMIHERVYYIQPPPYQHSLDADIIRRRFAEKYNVDLWPVAESSIARMAGENDLEKSEREREISRKMLYYIREFFHLTVRPLVTKKRLLRIGHFSRRNKNHCRIQG